MFDYVTGYVVFGALFLAGVFGYWIITRAFADPKGIYASHDTTSVAKE